MRLFLLAGLMLLLLWASFADGQQKRQAAIREDDDATIELGRKLFNDPRLSSNGKVSCASCHIERKGFASDGLPTGVSGKRIERRAPSLLNVVNRKHLFWDGRAKSLEEQMAGPLLNPDEMGNKTIAEVAERIELPQESLIAAIAAYERTIHSKPGRFDKFIAGENKNTLTVGEVRGWNLFRGKALCYQCHDSKWNFTDDDFHNTGVGYTVVSKDTPLQIDNALFADEDAAAGFRGGYFKDWGRSNVIATKKEMGKFRTQQLRGVENTAPYFHDGSVKSIEDVVEYYDRGGFRNKNIDKFIRPLGLTRQEKQDLVAFLRAL